MRHLKLLLGEGVEFSQTWVLKLLLCELLRYWNSLQVTVTLPGGSRKLT